MIGRRRPRGPGLGIFVFFFAAYLLTTSRERPWADATPVYQAAESFVTNGTLSVTTPWPPGSAPGRAGKHYAHQPILTSLVHVPGAFVRKVVGDRWPGTLPLTIGLACHLASAAMGALTCLLFFGLVRRLGASARAATLTTLVLGFSTMTWVYAHSSYTEITQAACFMGFVAALVRALDDPPREAGVRVGIWGALLLNTKLIYVLALPGPLLVLAALAWQRDRRRLLPLALGAGVPLALGLGVAMFYNWLRFESVWNTGYNAGLAPAMERGRLWVGLFGLFFSPGKSVFLYNPALLVAALAWWPFARRFRLVALLAAFATWPVILFYARFPFWHGDVAWGPRYLTFFVPAALLPLAFVRGRPRQVAAAGTAVVGLAITLLGNAFYWDHWSRIAVDARMQWLGVPNRGGAIASPGSDGCGVCVEDTCAMHYLPQFQPIRGYTWLARHVVAGDDWQTAERDAPWHPDTTLTLNLSSTYRRARFDWWVLDYGAHPIAATCIIVVLGLGVGWASIRWRRGVLSSSTSDESDRAPHPAA